MEPRDAVPCRTTQLMLGHGCRLSVPLPAQMPIKGGLKFVGPFVSFRAKKDRHSSPVGRSHGCLFLRSKSETGPSHRRAQNASAALRIFVRHPRKTFATVSATCGLTRRSKPRLVDHLVGADEERLRHGKAERLQKRSEAGDPTTRTPMVDIFGCCAAANGARALAAPTNAMRSRRLIWSSNGWPAPDYSSPNRVGLESLTAALAINASSAQGTGYLTG